ncbi:hypothetical protein EDB83DRAFT_186618 [Lactarius deliciosus]|nr:hypothetical protein EDB83DRAFT_186618 [Lactarius deliciosus]
MRCSHAKQDAKSKLEGDMELPGQESRSSRESYSDGVGAPVIHHDEPTATERSRSLSLLDRRHHPQCPIFLTRLSTYPKQEWVRTSPSLHIILFLPFSTPAAAPTGGYPPPSPPTQATQGEPNFIDGSGPIFSMYLEMAGEEDKKMVEGWKADADGILIFVRFYLNLLIPFH